MIAKTLVFVCAAFGLVAGSCFEIRAPQCSQSCSQVISIPAVSECAPVQTVSECSPCVSAPSCCDNSFSDVFSGCGSECSSCCLKPGNGPETSPVPVIQAPCVTLPAVEGPTVTLCSPPIPAPRVIAQRCICTKTIVKPQVIQRTVTVPRFQRYIKRTVTPVVENVSYKSTPISQGASSGSSSLVLSSGSGSSSLVLSSGSGSSPLSFSSGSGYGSCGSQSKIILSGSSCSRTC